MLLDAYKLEIWIALTILAFILGFIQIYGLYTFKSIQHLIICKKRYPSMVLIECYASMIILFIGIPLWVHSMFEATKTQTGIPWIEKFIEYAGFIVIVYAAHFIGNIEAVRLWLMYYDLNFIQTSRNELWKSQIDKSFSEKDWFLTNRMTWGNKQYIIRRVLIYYLFAATSSSIIFIILNGKYLFLAQFYDSMLWSVPITWSLYIYYKVPKDLNDNFLFLYEFRNTAILFTTGFIIYFINQIIHWCGFLIINVTLIALDAVWAIALPSLMSTLWIPRLILSNNIWQYPPELSMSMSSVDIVQMTHNHSNISAPLGKKISKNKKLLNVLKNEKRFEAFAHWMYREFSSETILCFIELVQFKELLKQQIIVIHDDVTDDNTAQQQVMKVKTKREYLLYENIPKSSIVNNDVSSISCDDITRFGNIAHLLYDKYIKINAEMEVNIGFGLRDTYYHLDKSNYKDVEPSKFIQLFDDVIEEMFKFMGQSFKRFDQQESREYTDSTLTSP